MNSTSDRGVVAEMAVGLLLCGAAYYFLVQPLDREVAETRSRAEALVAQGCGAAESGASGPTAEDLRACASRIAEKARDLHGRGRDAFNEVEMLASLTALTGENELVLEQLQPNQITTVRKPAAHSDPSLPPPPDDRQAGYTFTVRGEYGRIAAFLRSFVNRFPNTTIANLRVSPASEPCQSAVVAVVTTRHRAFDAGPALRLAEAAIKLPE